MRTRRITRIGTAVVAALLMVVATMAGAQIDEPGGTFIDDDGNVHEGNIEAITAEGIARGCNPPNNDRFCPADPVSRGEMAAFLNRSLNLSGSDTDHFEDDGDSVFEGDINALAAAGITRGCNPPDNDQFCPNESVTRDEMAAFLVRGFGYTDPGEGDLFTDDDGSVFEGDIDRLATAGVTLGCNPPDNDRFCPQIPVERDQMASFLSRALNLQPRTPPAAMTVAPYFFIGESGHQGRSGPFVAPVNRRVAETVAAAEATLEALFVGPTSGENASIPEITTAIPEGTSLNSVIIEEGVATVDVSAEFEARGAFPDAAMRVAQVVFSLTRFNSVSSVAFLQDGVPVEVRTDNAAQVDRPVNRNDYLDYQAAVSVESPTYGELVTDPLNVTGNALVFEATFQWALVDEDGEIIAEGTAMSESGVEWAPFDFTLAYEVDRSQRGALIVWVDSAVDGSQIDIREYPVILER